MVHMRFLGLGIPDSRWGDVLDEIIRILKPGGILEVSSNTLPSLAPY
jgi:ubiquinone/menaquinone biosynthesis C-methylase UbiE